mgnify:CR=1 FL=1
MKKIKIFNFGLPRTGTTSFHLYMKNNAFKSVHTNDGFINKCFPKDYFDFLNDTISKIILFTLVSVMTVKFSLSNEGTRYAFAALHRLPSF